jgi:hypothetical protein
MERMLLGEDFSDDEPLFVPTPSSKSPKRQQNETLGQSSQYHLQFDDTQKSYNNFQVDEAQESDNDDGYIIPAPSQRRRRSNRRKPSKMSHDILRSLVNRRKLKSARTSQSTNVSSEFRTLEHPKRPQRLPVNELITVSERLEDFDFYDDNGDGESMELSQDPISHISGSESESEQPKYNPIKHRTKGKRHKGIRPIDVAKFRFPDVSFPHSSHRSLQSPSYCDGFEGREAEPIGRKMPVKSSSFRRGTPQRVAIQLGQLILVAEKPSLPTANRCCRKKRKRRSAAEPQAHHSLHRNDEMQVVEQHESDTTMTDAFEDQGHLPQDHECDQNPIAQDVELKKEAGHEHEHKHEPQLDNTELAEANIAHVHGVEDQLSQLGCDQLTKAIVAENQDRGDSSEKDASVADSELLEPLTLQITSGDEQSSEYNGSTTSLSQRRLQSMPHDGVESNKSENHVQTLHNSAAGRSQIVAIPFSQRSMVSSNSRKTPKQAKADIKAMLEMSMVSVTRRPSPDEDEDDSDNRQHSDEEEYYEESQSADSYQSSDGDEPDGGSSDMAIEQEFEQEDPPAMNQQSSRGDEDQQNEYERDVSKQPDVEDGTLSMHLALSLQDVAKNALKLDNINQASCVAIENGPLALLQDDIRSKQPRLLPTYNEYLDSSWRPTAPIYSGLSMEVDEDIEDSPTPIRRRASQRRASQVCATGQRSQLSSQALYLVRSRRVSPSPIETVETQHDTQGSIILGETQNFVLPERIIPETQCLEEDPAEPRFQVFDRPSYFAQASQTLNEQFHKIKITRAKSSPAHVHLDLDKDAVNLMPPSELFKSTISPPKPSRLPTLTQETLTPINSPNALTRKASQGMGTLPANARSKSVLMRFKPPFKNMSQDVDRTGA